MSRARYKFDPSKKYFAWVVAAKLVEMPSVGESVRAVKVTLATPCFLDGGKAVASQQMEAVVWAFLGEEPDEAFLADSGVALSGGQCDLPRWKSFGLWCTFGEPEGDSDFQALERHETVPPSEYPIEPILAAPPLPKGLTFGPGGAAAWNGVPIQLTPMQTRILQALARRGPVSPAQLRRAVKKWDGRTLEHTIAEAVSALRKKLPAGLTISDRDGADGWSLVADES